MFFKKKKDKPDDSAALKPSAENPYLAGRQEWLERYGSYISRAKQWRFFALLTLGALLLSGTGNIIQAQKATVGPYFVSVDSLGRAAVTRIENPGAPPRALVQAELGNVVINWRTVTADSDLQQRMVQRLSMFTAGAARGVIQNYFQENNPYRLAADGKLVSVSLAGVPLPVSQDSWRVEWTETIRDHAGTELERRRWQATMRLRFQPPSTDAQIMVNPGGIYVTELNFSAMLEPR